MKKYIEPIMIIGAGVMGEDIAENGILPGSVDEQLGKERSDFGEDDIKKETDSWNDGLW